MNNHTNTHELAVVLYQQDRWWIAQCLQYDIGAQAFSPSDVLYELQRALIGHAVICEQEGLEPFSNLKAAPKRYWNLWEGAKIKLMFEREPFRSPSNKPLPKPTVRLAECLAA